MKTSSLQFKKAIKSNVRELDVRFIFYNGDKKYVIKGKDIQSHKYNAICEKELGGIEKKILTITLMSNVITKLINEGTVLYKETWAKFNNVWYSDFQEKLIVSAKKIDEGKSTIKIEAVDTLTLIREEPMPYVAQEMNTTLNNYFKSVLSKLSENVTIPSNLVNTNLSLGFLKSNEVHENLLELAIASQALIRTDFTIKKFTKTDIVDRLNYGSGLIDYSVDADDLDTYSKVVVALFSPTAREYKNLGSIMTTLPPAARAYRLGTIEFDALYIPQLMVFDSAIEMDDYRLSSSSCSLTVTSKVNAIVDLTTQFYGLDVNSVKTSEDNDENRTKFINNIYIQSPAIYDTRIYTSKPITIKYTGNTLYEVGDTIRVDNKYDVLILEHDLTYDGSLRGTIKGVIIDGE